MDVRVGRVPNYGHLVTRVAAGGWPDSGCRGRPGTSHKKGDQCYLKLCHNCLRNPPQTRFASVLMKMHSDALGCIDRDIRGLRQVAFVSLGCTQGHDGYQARYIYIVGGKASMSSTFAPVLVSTPVRGDLCLGHDEKIHPR